MYTAAKIQAESKAEFYQELSTILAALLADETDWLANLANAAALLFDQLPDINWAGFYLKKDGQLVLGPFQGKPACTRIPLGKGVCGTAAARGETLVVQDVHQFPGHIACDPNSRSEIVLPMKGALPGVLDIDSPVLRRFDQEDARGLQAFLDLLQKSIKK
ncbi:MAG: GAF domain-containing protein [Bacillota bacterium]|jgi:L-methionine (R)-S-oxide reductase